jgi:hypothetical protein
MFLWYVYLLVHHLLVFYFWILHPVASKIRIVGNTVPATISIVIGFIVSYCHYMFLSLFDNLHAEYTILVFGNCYIDNGSIVLDSIFIIVYYMLLGLMVCF